MILVSANHKSVLLGLLFPPLSFTDISHTYTKITIHVFCPVQ